MIPVGSGWWERCSRTAKRVRPAGDHRSAPWSARSRAATKRSTISSSALADGLKASTRIPSQFPDNSGRSPAPAGSTVTTTALPTISVRSCTPAPAPALCPTRTTSVRRTPATSAARPTALCPAGTALATTRPALRSAWTTARVTRSRSKGRMSSVRTSVNADNRCTASVNISANGARCVGRQGGVGQALSGGVDDEQRRAEVVAVDGFDGLVGLVAGPGDPRGDQRIVALGPVLRRTPDSNCPATQARGTATPTSPRSQPATGRDGILRYGRARPAAMPCTAPRTTTPTMTGSGRSPLIWA